MSRRISIPDPDGSFSPRDSSHEGRVRRLIEGEIQKNADDIEELRLKTEKQDSLSLRRFQFLTMGAPNG